MQIFIFLFYFFLFAGLITIIPFYKKSGIGKWLLVSLFAIKIAAGFGYAFYYSLPQNVATADTWKFYKSSLPETDWLLHNPAAFFKDLFYSPYRQNSSLFSGTSSYWNDLKDNAIIKLMAIINVFTGKSYYANIIVFNFLFLFGSVALFRIAQPLWSYNKLWLILSSFLLPSFLFWCSGVHKDGLIFSALMICIYCVWKQLNAQRFMVMNSLLMAACFIVLFALRNAILFLLLPAMSAWLISTKMPHYKWLIFYSFYGVGVLLFFVLPHLSFTLNFPQYIVNKQAEFRELSGRSKIELPVLKPTAASFAAFFPYAIDLLFFQPHVNRITGISYLFTFIENSFLFLFLLAWLLWHKPLKQMKPVLLFFLFFSLSIWLICSYTVTFSGAITRYKSIALPLFAMALLVTLDYKRVAFVKRMF